MTAQNKVSIIVPIYNAENYLTECIESILRQKHKEIEIILVDDASTDKSGAIADRYASIDKRVRVVHNKTNKGIAAPNRNIGIDMATGDYVCFVDSDDYIDDDWVEVLLYEAQEYLSDAVRGYLVAEVENKTAEKAFGDIAAYEAYYNDTMKQIISEDKRNMRASVCYAIYSKKVVDYHKLRFDETLRNGEDELFNMMFGYYAAKIITASRKTYYHRRIRSGSIMTAENAANESVYSKIRMIHAAVDFMNSKKDYSQRLYVDRFFDLYNPWTSALRSVTNEKYAEKIITLWRDALKKVKYKREILARMPCSGLPDVAQIKQLEAIIAQKDAEIQSFLGVRRATRLLVGNIRRRLDR